MPRDKGLDRFGSCKRLLPSPNPTKTGFCEEKKTMGRPNQQKKAEIHMVLLPFSKGFRLFKVFRG